MMHLRAGRIVLLFVISLILAPRALHAQSDYAARASEGKLSFTFVGNESFAITDGELTIMTEYPYTPGVEGYMKYDMEAVRPKGFVMCLITHGHKDHFLFGAYIGHSWSLIGPAAVTDPIRGYDTIAVLDGESIDFEGVRIDPVATPHSDLEHYSYLVTWHGVRMYFPGDTAIDTYLLEMQDLDVAFVTPWLLKLIQEKGAKIDARHIVVYHHKLDEDVVDYAGRVVPAQGNRFEIEFRESASSSQ